MKPPEKIPQIDWQNGAYSTVPSTYTVELTYVVARSTNRKCSKKVRSVEEKGGRASCK